MIRALILNALAIALTFQVVLIEENNLSDQSQNIELESNLFLPTDLLVTPDITIRMVTEAPVDGVAYREGYSTPCVIVNFGAKLESFEVEGDRARGYKGSVVPGDFSFLPPGSVLQGCYQGLELSYAYIMLPLERFNPMYAEKMLIMQSDPLIQKFAQALYTHRHRNDPNIMLYRESMSEALVQHLQLVHLENNAAQFKQKPDLERLKSYIKANLNHKLTVGELAKLEKTTPKLLQQAVKQKYGQSVYEWIVTLRLERSLLLLRNKNFDLAAIAGETGFANQSHWTRLFRRHFGITPGKFRSQLT
ncbi:MAG: AraC family transcriptional regulator [Cyanobacteria bacterium P01_A01_bin.83]